MTPVQLKQLPSQWLDILIKIEDPSFYQHKGVDVSTPGAGLTTITQALTKYLYFQKFSPGFAKLEQTLIARFIVTPSFSKEEQLTIFINTAYLGHHQGQEVRGFPKAAELYFKKEFLSLSEDEYVALVAMLVSPKSFHVLRAPEDNLDRVRRIKRVLSGQYRPLDVRDIRYDRMGG